MSDTRNMIAKLEDFSGGLNWMDDIPKPNEFKSLIGWENHGSFLKGVAGRTAAYASAGSAFDRVAVAPTLYRSADDTEYICFGGFQNGHYLSAMGPLESSAYTFNKALDLATTQVVLSGYTNDGLDMIQVFDKMFVFSDLWTVKTKNQILEYDTSTDSDFKARDMGITAPSTKATVTTQAAGSLTGKYRYKFTWAKLDGSSILQNESGGNTDSSNAYHSEIEPSGEDVLISITDTTSDDQVTHARIYRTPNLNNAYNKLEYYKLQDVAVSGGAIAATITDDQGDDDKLRSDASFLVLYNEFDAPLPLCTSGTYSKGRVFCSDGSKIYFTSGKQEQGGLETYDVRYDFLNAKFDDGQDVKSLFKFKGNVIVVKESKTGIIVNSDPANGIQWTDENIGSVYRRSIVETPYGLIGLTNKGVRIHNGVKWSDQDLGEKVMTVNSTDGTNRLTQAYQQTTSTNFAVGFFYQGKYYLKVTTDASDELGQYRMLVFDFKYGWSELPREYMFDGAVVYNRGDNVMTFINDPTPPNSGATGAHIMFSGSDNEGSNINGVIQHGYLVNRQGQFEVDNVRAIMKTSFATSVFLKTPDAMHCTVSDTVPAGNLNEMNMYHRGMPGGYRSSSHIAVKLKGSLNNESFYYGQEVYGRTYNDYNDESKFTTGLIGRYNCDTFSGTAINDVSGNGMGLTASISAATIATSTTGIARKYSIAMANAGAETAGFINTTGFDISANSEWTFAGKITLADGGDMPIFRNTKNSQNIALEWSDASENLTLAVGDVAVKTPDSVFADNTSYNLFLKYRYLGGVYGTDLTYTVDLYIDGTSQTMTTATATATAATGFELLLTDQNNGCIIDEIRIYDRALDDDEITGLNDEFYDGDEDDPQYL